MTLDQAADHYRDAASRLARAEHHRAATHTAHIDTIPLLGRTRVDDHTIAHAVREWAIANGDNPRHRIALCGYEPEHIDHMPDTWHMHSYSASKSYGSSAGGGVNDANRALERIWFSPHCLTAEAQGTLFGGEAA